MVERLTPRELEQRLGRGEELVLLDVREPAEVALCALPDSVFIPLGELAVRARELDPERPTVCICHHGLRSANAAAALERLGFETVYNLSGGLDRWALEVDPAMRRYGPTPG